MTWNDCDDDDPPAVKPHESSEFPVSGHPWFRARIRVHLFEKVSPKTLLDEVVEWFARSPRKYVFWAAEQSYRGTGYSDGAWHLHGPQIDQDLCGALAPAREAARRRADAERFPTLEAWLQAERSGELEHRGALGSKYGDGLPNALVRALREAARIRRNGWPRMCATCKGTFQSNRPAAKRCASCRSVPKSTPVSRRASAIAATAEAARAVPMQGPVRAERDVVYIRVLRRVTEPFEASPGERIAIHSTMKAYTVLMLDRFPRDGRRDGPLSYSVPLDALCVALRKMRQREQVSGEYQGEIERLDSLIARVLGARTAR